ncbi:MAG TPA: chemotaxis response regulator protein-glutamate methylesterase [Bacteroidota bacterium]|jgi:two-component system chemotaxis response regulator CheB|nr:chemotaxis response regulator protein-glutamate methylesterase [Bacteroidota bacterium]
MVSGKIKVLVVDDAAVFRQSVSTVLNADSDIYVVGTAPNGKIALTKIEQLNPDVVTLDVEMPEMDGLETLKNIKQKFPHIGVIMFSVHTERGAKQTIEALSLGAFDFVTKPSGTGSFSASMNRIREELVPLIKEYWAKFNKKGENRVIIQKPPERRAPVIPPGIKLKIKKEAVAIGVSTGGPNALAEIIPKFPAKIGVPVFIVQHMPPIFTKQLAERLNSKSNLRVVEARDNEIITPDKVYIAPGNYHMEVKERNGEKIISLNQGPLENSCRPAVDVLFRSVAKLYGKKALGVILTGMGKDGFLGSEMMKQNGAYIIAQDQESSVVWGMPRFVVEAGIADEVVNLNEMTDTILSNLS